MQPARSRWLLARGGDVAEPPAAHRPTCPGLASLAATSVLSWRSTSTPAGPLATNTVCARPHGYRRRIRSAASARRRLDVDVPGRMVEGDERRLRTGVHQT